MKKTILLLSFIFIIYSLIVFSAGCSKNNPSDPQPTAVPTATPGKIAFTSDRDGGLAEVYTMNSDGTGAVRLTNNSVMEWEPAWSLDGGKIAFTSNRDANEEVYTMNADGSVPLNTTNNSAGDSHPAWSPDGNKIAFTSDRDGNSEIYVMNANGTGQANITNNSSNDTYPAWSPDGNKIAFVSFRDGNNEIYAMNAEGGGEARLTYSSADDLAPAWSPDGSKIAFQSSRDGNYEIYVMGQDGSLPLNRSNNGASDTMPAWSPDGSKIVFMSSRDGDNEIFMINENGSGLVNLTGNSADDRAPEWLIIKTPIIVHTGTCTITAIDTATKTQTTTPTNTPDDTPTPAETSTVTETATATNTPTSLPTVIIQAYFGFNEGMNWFTAVVKENNIDVSNACVEFDNLSDANPPVPMAWTGSAYQDASMTSYVAGSNYQIKAVVYDGRTFTASAVSPGGITVSSDKTTVQWTEPGTIDYSWVMLYDSSNTLVHDAYTITSPYTITYVYTPGNYSLFVRQEKYTNAFTGSGIDLSGSYLNLYEKIRDDFTK